MPCNNDLDGLLAVSVRALDHPEHALVFVPEEVAAGPGELATILGILAGKVGLNIPEERSNKIMSPISAEGS